MKTGSSVPGDADRVFVGRLETRRQERGDASKIGLVGDEDVLHAAVVVRRRRVSAGRTIGWENES